MRPEVTTSCQAVGGHAMAWDGFHVHGGRTILDASALIGNQRRGFGRESRRIFLLNRYDRPSPMAGEAEVKFLDGDFRIVRPGAFVRCAVTGVPIPLEELKYWSVEEQEAYASPEAVMRRMHPQQVK